MKINESLSIDYSTMKQFGNRTFLRFQINDADVMIVWKGNKMSDSTRFTSFTSLSEAIHAWNNNDFYNLYY